jgi:hypothetical protein
MLWAYPAFYSIGTGLISRAQSGWDLELTTHLRLVLRLRMSGAIPLLSLLPSWRGQGKLHTYLIYETVFFSTSLAVSRRIG